MQMHHLPRSFRLLHSFHLRGLLACLFALVVCVGLLEESHAETQTAKKVTQAKASSASAQARPPAKAPSIPKVVGQLLKSKASAKRVRPVRRYFRRRRLRRPHRQAGSDFNCWSYLRRTGQPYCVELLTIGKGNWLFTYFGHNGLRVVSRHSRDLVYNFGTFSAAKPLTLVFNYLQFKLQYQLTTIPYRYSLHHYRRADRTMTGRRLQLTPKETLKLVRHLRYHHRKENRAYPYHHYTNNCSTKVRDALRLALGPSFYKRAQVKRGATYRKLVMQSMASNPVVLVLMDFGMGPPTDRPLTWWQEMFLPHHLEAYLADPVWKKERGRALVGASRSIYKRKRPPAEPFSAAKFVWIIAILWLFGAVFLYKRQGLRWYIRSIVGLFALLGTALFLMLVGTNFPEPPGNVNILWFHPLHWVLWWWLGRKRWERATVARKNLIRRYFVAHAGVACLYLLLKLTPVVPLQMNAHYVFFALFVFGIGAARLRLVGTWGEPKEKVEEPNEQSDEKTEETNEGIVPA